MTIEEQKSRVHPSHRLSSPYSGIRAPAGTPRFYTVTKCELCEYEMIEHSAGFFADRELFFECENAEKSDVDTEIVENE